MSIARWLLIILMLWLLIGGLAPLVGFSLYLPFKFSALDLTGHMLRLVTIKSAVFLTMAYFIVNYLRHRRPLSSVAPLLVFNNFLILFGSYFLILYDPKAWVSWIFLVFMTMLSLIFYVENERESKTIFVDDW